LGKGVEGAAFEGHGCLAGPPVLLRDIPASSTALSHLCQQVKGFFGSLEEKSAQLRCVQQAVENIEDNIQWMDRNLEKVKTWLQNNHL